MQRPILYAPGTLWNATVGRSVPSRSIPMRVVSGPACYRDDHATKRRDDARKGNPLLLYDTDLFVTNVTPM